MPIDYNFEKKVITAYTEKLKANPLLEHFITINEEYYKGKIEKPIDLSKIRANIDNNVYTSFNDWYDDLILLFDNTINFYKIHESDPNSEFIKISNYFKDMIERDFKLRRDKSDELFFELLTKYINKYRKILYNSPVIQCDDGILSQIIHESRNLKPQNDNVLSILFEFFNPKLSEPEIHRNVYNILEKTSSDIEFKADKTIEITLNDLKDETKNPLIYYMNVLKSYTK